MNIRIVFVLAILLAYRSITAGELPAAGKRIAVLEFSVQNVDVSYARALRNKIEIALYEKRLNVIEQKQISRILFEMGSTHTCRESTCAINQGKIVSAEYVVVGEVTYAGNYLITLRIVEVPSGRIIFASSFSVKSKDEILSESQKAAETLSDSLERKLEKNLDAKESLIIKRQDKEPEKALINKKEGEKSAAVNEITTRSSATLAGDISIQGGYLLPLAFLWTDASNGFDITASGGFVIQNCFIGVKTGFMRLYSRDHKAFSSVVPLMLRFSYSFNISQFFISPGLSAGLSYNHIHAKGIHEFEIMISPGMAVGYRLTRLARLFVYTDYYCIIENKRGIQFITFGAGTGFSF